MTESYGRYAPSPTGVLHIGNLRTALLAWAFAYNSGRKFLIRMEDIDERSRPEYISQQLRDLETLGISWDKLVIQSKNRDYHRHMFHVLHDQDLLYECYCTRRELREIASAPHGKPGFYQGTCAFLSERERKEKREQARKARRSFALRLRTDADSFTIHDTLAGDYVAPIDDFVIRRSDGLFSYNFLNVVDDIAQGVTQIVRGNDLLSSTPRQGYLWKMLANKLPSYIHVPLIVNKQRIRLSKRDQSITLSELTSHGIAIEHIINTFASSLHLHLPDDHPITSASLFAEALAYTPYENINTCAWIYTPEIFES
ncbi:MAG: tRNA glutamyl-Q(34) synthetase GluQRS [Actinomycetaceae bacterium]|nr:tRNA glutamyl-Q(34) synthetase GluQRS [Actinomycetaceae bacterium]